MAILDMEGLIKGRNHYKKICYSKDFGGSFEVGVKYFLVCFNIVFSFKFFPKSVLNKKVPHRCPKRVRGGGSRSLLDNVQKKQIFFKDDFSKSGQC